MASAENQKPTCPVCSRSDDVKTMQAAYESGVDKCAPPDMPTKKVSMMPYIIFSGFIIGICIFLIIVLIGGNSGHPAGGLPVAFQYVLLAITLVCIVTALGLSYYAFQRVVKGDNEASVLFPAWDRATATWRNLSYCAHDDTVFDPQNGGTLTEKQLAELRTLSDQTAETQSAAIAGGH